MYLDNKRMRLLRHTSTSLGRRMLPEVTLHSYMECRTDSCCSRTIDLASFRIKWIASLRDRIDKQMASKTDEIFPTPQKTIWQRPLRCWDMKQSGEKPLHHKDKDFSYFYILEMRFLAKWLSKGWIGHGPVTSGELKKVSNLLTQTLFLWCQNPHAKTLGDQ